MGFKLGEIPKSGGHTKLNHIGGTVTGTVAYSMQVTLSPPSEFMHWKSLGTANPAKVTNSKFDPGWPSLASTLRPRDSDSDESDGGLLA